jgi:uncharacterized membrane protein YfcA
MKKIDLLIGAFIGFLSTLFGIYLFFKFFTTLEFFEGIKNMRTQGLLGKIITLGAVVNLIVFFILLKLNKELMARGVVLSLIILTVITLII